IICYTVPTGTLTMLKEYYANAGCCHLSSVLWHALSTNHQLPEKNATRLYYTILDNLLVLTGQEQNKLVFSKIVTLQDQADLFYYMIACSRLLKADEHWVVNIRNEEAAFDLPGDSI